MPVWEDSRELSQVSLKMPQEVDFTFNKELNRLEMFKEIILKSKPTKLFFMLTTDCNLNCIMCAQEKGHTLPFEVFKGLRNLFPYLELIDWQGGEVFLVDYFKGLFRELSEYSNIKQGIYTNGLFIDKEWAEIISQTRAEVTLSIDAISKDTYEGIRRGAKFESLLNNIELLTSACEKNNSKVTLSINAVVMRRNYKELYLFPAFCKRFKISYVRFDFLKPNNKAAETGFLKSDMLPHEDILNSIRFSEEDIFIKRDDAAIEFLKDSLIDIENEFKKLGIYFDCTFKPFLFQHHKDSPCTDVKDEDPADKDALKCPSPWERLFIDFEGRVRPDCLCTSLVGNICKSSIEDLWNSEGMQTYRRRIIEGHPKGWCTDICVAKAVEGSKFEKTDRTV